MRLQCLLIGLILLLLPAMVSAELYRYTDERGVIHFTDNYIEIPESQRPKVEIINRLTDTTPPEVTMESDRSDAVQPPAEGIAGGQPNAEADAQGLEAAQDGAPSQQAFESLIKVKSDLDKIYDALAAEKASLEVEQQTLKTVESIRAFQNKVNLFNERLADYERRRQVFQTQADAYNATISK